MTSALTQNLEKPTVICFNKLIYIHYKHVNRAYWQSTTQNPNKLSPFVDQLITTFNFEHMNINSFH